jgi:hypothetical protein
VGAPSQPRSSPAMYVDGAGWLRQRPGRLDCRAVDRDRLTHQRWEISAALAAILPPTKGRRLRQHGQHRRP